MPELLPIIRSPDYQYTVRLDGVRYRFRFIYNTRSDTWRFDMRLAADNTVLVLGAAIVLGEDMLSIYQRNPDVPRGSLVVVDTTGDATRIGREELAETARLVYIGEEESGAV